VAAVAVYTMGCGLLDSLRGFVMDLIESKKAVEELYLGIAMVETFGAMVAASIVSNHLL
jgi:hypothetical protein